MARTLEVSSQRPQSLDQIFIGLRIEQHDFGAAVDGQHFRGTGLFDPGDVLLRVSHKVAHGMDLTCVQHSFSRFFSHCFSK